MIPDFKTYIGESIWADIYDRSSGIAVRKEDDINNLDIDGFYGYLKDHYKLAEYCQAHMSGGQTFIKIPIFVVSVDTNKQWYEDRPQKVMLLNFIEHRVEIRSPHFETWPKKLRTLLSEKYNVEEGLTKVGDHMCFLTNNNGESNNEFFLDVIDTIIDNAEYPTLIKSK